MCHKSIIKSWNIKLSLQCSKKITLHTLGNVNSFRKETVRWWREMRKNTVDLVTVMCNDRRWLYNAACCACFSLREKVSLLGFSFVLEMVRTENCSSGHSGSREVAVEVHSWVKNNWVFPLARADSPRLTAQESGRGCAGCPGQSPNWEEVQGGGCPWPSAPLWMNGARASELSAL